MMSATSTLPGSCRRPRGRPLDNSAEGPVDSLDDHPAKALAQRAGLRADRILSQMRPGW